MHFRADSGTADDAAATLQAVRLDGVVAVPYPASTNVSAAIEGASLGHSLAGLLGDLNTVVDAKALNLRQIVEIMAQADAALAGGLP